MNVKAILSALLIWAGLVTGASAASNIAYSTTAVNGYDLVSYQTGKRPLRDNGHFVSVHDGVSFLFVNEENKATFDRNPDKYLPAYGGYCAFGVAVGKKFVGDPEVWRIIDGRLYLNLDENIQDQWLKDVPGRIKTADKNWTEIRDKAPSDL
jgi:YHS domain-containing protein